MFSFSVVESTPHFAYVKVVTVPATGLVLYLRLKRGAKLVFVGEGRLDAVIRRVFQGSF